MSDDAGGARAKPKLKERLYGVPVVGTALRMQDRYVDDAADQLAAAIGFFGFLSLFPLLLLALAVAGFVLADDPAARARFADTVIDAIPGFAGAFGSGDSAVADAIDGLSRNAGSVGLIGAVSLLATGLKVINSANVATLTIFHVDVEISGALRRVRQVAVLLLLGLLALVGVAATGLVGAAASLATDEVAAVTGAGERVDVVLQTLATVAGLVGSLVADFLLFVVSYRLLSYGSGPRVRELWPGALLAAVGWTVLKAFGATYVSGQIARTNELIGAFGGVVGLLLLLYLAGRVYLYGAELTALLRRPGADLADRYEQVTYEGENADVIGPALVERKRRQEEAASGRTARGRAGRPPQAAAPQRPAPAAPAARSSAPSPGQSSPAVSPATRSRLQELDAERRSRRDVGLGGPTGLGGTAGEREGRVVAGRRSDDGGSDVRGAAAIAFGVGAVGALVAIAKPWKGDR